MANKALSFVSSVFKNLIQYPAANMSTSWSMMPRSQRNYAREVGSGLNNSIVVSAVNWIARNFPEAPLILLDTDKKTNETITITAHPMLKLISRPNRFYSGTLLWGATLTDLTIAGNAYWIKVRNKIGEVVELWYCPQHLMTPISNTTEFISGYLYSPDGRLNKGVEYTTEDVVHFRFGIDPNNMAKGLSPLASLLREIYTDDEASNFSASIVTNLGVPGVIISPANMTGNPSQITTDAEKIKRDFSDRFTGDKRGEPLVFTSPTSVTTLTWTPQEMNLTGLRRLPEERVSAVLGIPAMVLGLGAGLEHSCLPGYTRIWTQNGIVEIKDIQKGDKVLSLNNGKVEYHDVNAHWLTGKKKIYEIRTKNRTIRATANHPFFVRQNGLGGVGSKVGNSQRKARVEPRYLENLKVGDKIVQLQETPDLGNIYLPDGSLASVDFMKFAGMLLGDGYIGEKLGYIQVCLPKKDNVRDQYEIIIRNVIKDNNFTRRDGTIQPKFTDSRSGFSFKSRSLVDKCINLELNGYSVTKRIPSWVFGLSKELRLAYLAGLIDSDGTIDKRGVATICQANENLVHDLKDLFLSCGIPSSNVHKKEIHVSQLPNSGSKEWYYAWAFAVSSAKLLSEIPFEDISYREKVNNNLNRYKNIEFHAESVGLPKELGFYTISSITEIGEEDVYDIEVDQAHNFIANGFLVKNSFTNMQSAKEAAYENNIIPTQKLLSEELHLQLLRDFESEEKLDSIIVHFDLTNVRALMTDMTEIFKRADMGMNSGWMTVAEARKMVGLFVDETHNVYLRNWRVVAVPPEKARDLPLQAIPNTSRGIGGSGADLVPLPAEPRDIFGSTNPASQQGEIPIPVAVPVIDTPKKVPAAGKEYSDSMEIYIKKTYSTAYQKFKLFSRATNRKLDEREHKTLNSIDRNLLTKTLYPYAKEMNDLTLIYYTTTFSVKKDVLLTEIELNYIINGLSEKIIDHLTQYMTYNKVMKIDLVNFIDTKDILTLLLNSILKYIYREVGVNAAIDAYGKYVVPVAEINNRTDSIYLPVLNTELE